MGAALDAVSSHRPRTSQQPIGKAGELSKTSTSSLLPVCSSAGRGFRCNDRFLLFSPAGVKSSAIAVPVSPSLRMRSAVAGRTLRGVPGRAMGLPLRALKGNGGLDGKKGWGDRDKRVCLRNTKDKFGQKEIY